MGLIKFVVFVVQNIFYNLFFMKKRQMLSNCWRQQSQACLSMRNFAEIFHDTNTCYTV